MAGCMALLIALPAAPAMAQIRLPALGEVASADLSIGAERRLGDQIMREGRRDPAFLDDPVLQQYLQSLWDPLVASARHLGNIDSEIDRAFTWEPFLVRDRSVNAFALPGGYVGVHLGLIALTSTSDQLASVLAHELSHVTQRHIARSIAPQANASIVALAAMLLGILAASRSNNVDAANAAIVGGQAAAIQGQLNFSRDMEREADRVGFGVLTDAGYSPAGMAAMFEKLDLATRLNDNNGFPYLRSHPLTVDRIAEARNRTLVAGSQPRPPTLQHALMQARARVLMDDSAQGLQRLNGGSSSPLLADRVGALYAGAMAASLLLDPARADALAAQALEQARSATPREPQAERTIILLQAQLRLTRGEPAAAMQVLDTLGPHADERPAMLLRAQATLDLNRRQPESARTGLRASTEALQTWVAEHPIDATAWELLSACSGALGLKLRAARADAEARAVLGDLTGAIDRLRAAQQASRSTTSGQDFIEGSVIDSRLRLFTAQRRQLALEARGERGDRGDRGDRGGPEDPPAQPPPTTTPPPTPTTPTPQ